MQYKQQNYSVDKKLFYAWFEAMHTRIDIAIAVDIQRVDLIELVDEMEKLVNNYEQIANRFDLKSEISFVNINGFENEIKVSDQLYDLLEICQIHNYKTKGYFDVTANSTPILEEILNPYVLYAKTKKIKLAHSGVLIDFSGFLKGYVLEKLIDIVKIRNIENILINIGNSSIYAKGNHPFGSGWKLKIPATDTECIFHNECLTTSGNTEVTKWKIINPLLKQVVENKKPVSIISTSPADGEVVSKVAYIAPISELEMILKTYNARIV